MRKSLEKAAVALAVGGSLATFGCAAPEHEELSHERATGSLQALTTGPQLIATGVLNQATDLAQVSDLLENGLPQNVLGGVGSALAFAGGTTFLGVPDRGPNATPYSNGAQIDNTSSFISRFETLDLKLSAATSGALPFNLTAALKATTLLFSQTQLVYGSTPGLPSAVPLANSAGKFYFTGRSDNFGAGLSTNPDFARLDPEGLVVSNDGNTVFVADEYGPYVYQFDRLSGRRLRSYALPDSFAAPHLYALGASEISGNTIGRVTNKGMEGLTITPDGATLVGLMQSPLLQDGGDGGRANRLVTIDVGTGATHAYVYDNLIGSKAYNSSEILALNSHQFLIDTRDGKGLGDGSTAVIKQLWAVDIAGATDVSGLSGASTLLPRAVPKQRFLDIVAVLNAKGIVSTQIPAKIEGLAFGPDVMLNGVATHTLYVANDNDFLPNVAGPNLWYVFGFTDADLAALGLSYQPRQIAARDADLALHQQTSTSSVVTGSQVSFTLTARNTGLVPATNVSITDVLAPELQLTGCSAQGATCQTTGNSASIAVSSLAGDVSQTATLAATLSCAVADGAQITNQASVSFEGSDATADDDSATATITAVNPAPAINGVALSTSVIWPPNKKMVPVTVSYDAADNCPGTVCALKVDSNEPSSGNGSDWTIADAHTVLLRADRNGSGSGRIYAITISCQDSGGAVSTRNAEVTVPHNR